MDLNKMQQNTVDKMNKEIETYTFLSIKIKDLLEELTIIRDGFVALNSAKDLEHEVNSKMNDMMLEKLIGSDSDIEEFEDFLKEQLFEEGENIND